jgi:phage terminase small subunit
MRADQVPTDPQDPQAQRRREVFVAEYLVDLNGKRAAIEAGFSENGAATKACNLLKEPWVAEQVRQGLEDRKKLCMMEAGAVLHEMMTLGFSNMKDFIRVQEDGSAYVDLSALTEEQGRCIREVESETYMDGKGEAAREVKKVKLKLHDKTAPLRDLAKMLGKLIERTEVSGPGGGAIQVVFTDDPGEIPKQA